MENYVGDFLFLAAVVWFIVMCGFLLFMSIVTAIEKRKRHVKKKHLEKAFWEELYN